MSTPSEQPFDPNDLTAYAPKWARKANEEARRRSEPAANDDRPIVAFHDAVDALREFHLRERTENEPAAEKAISRRGGFYIENFRVPPSLDPTRLLDPSPVSNPFSRRPARSRISRSTIVAGKFMVATSVAALVAFLLVGKFPSQRTAGATPELQSFKQIASLGPVAPVIPEAEPRMPEPVAAHPVSEPVTKNVNTVTLPTTKVQEPRISVATPATAPGTRNRVAATIAATRAVAPLPIAPPLATTPAAGRITPPARSAPVLDAEELAILMKRSEEFIGAGDFASARIVLRRAAESGNASAALTLAGTFDPAVLQRFGVAGMLPDPKQAKYWYEKAREMGSNEAERLLEQLVSNP